MREPSAAVDLIEQAFGLARRSGKSDWWAMTIPVLKNRLLLLTKGSFKETDFGAASFRDFLSKVTDIVRIDEAPPPGFVILRSAAPARWEQQPANKFRGERIRADLWRATLDYSSARKYLWDTSQQVAKPAGVGEDGLVLPTVSSDDLHQWRAEFVASHKLPDEETTHQIEQWHKNRLPTVGLPTTMRPAWNSYLKRKVEQRLQHWFESNSIKAPPIVEVWQQSGASERHVEMLREFILSCVRAMSKDELLELRISPDTAMRTVRANKSSNENED
jgi:hypothetical protein